MTFFIDTNIAVGYSIIHDKWHPQCDEFINNCSDSVFWSNLVQEEYTKKLENIIDVISIFLEDSEDILINNQHDFVNYYEFEDYILHKTKQNNLDSIKKKKILWNFWKKYNFSEGISEIISSKFTSFIENFEEMYYTRDGILKNIAIIHDCGLNNYLKYLDYANRLLEWGIHSPDCKIVTDAHDCGVAHDNLIFVSTDEEMITNITSHDYSFLNIIEFKSCN